MGSSFSSVCDVTGCCRQAQYEAVDDGDKVLGAETGIGQGSAGGAGIASAAR